MYAEKPKSSRIKDIENIVPRDAASTHLAFMEFNLLLFSNAIPYAVEM